MKPILILTGTLLAVLLMMLVFSLSLLAMAQTPLDALQPRAEPVQSVSLSGLSPTSALSIAGMNQNLTTWKDRPLPDFGKYFSGTRWLDNGQAGVPDVLINFSAKESPLPESVDSELKNLTPVVVENKGLVFV